MSWLVHNARSIEALVIVAVALLGLGPVLWALWRRDRPELRLLALGCAGVVAVALWNFVRLAPVPVAEAAVEDRPAQVERDGYVGSKACRACHPAEYATWHRSYHRTMTQVATAQTAAGRFDGQPVRYAGRDYTPYIDGNTLRVKISALGRQPAEDREIVLSTGSHNMQFYWMTGDEDRRVEPLALVWLIHEARWIPTESSFIKPPGSHHDAGFGNWNEACIRCHATHGVPKVAAREGREEEVQTEVAELGIACEACHGPGAAHVSDNRIPLRRYAQHFSNEGDSSVVQPARLDPARSAEVCGNCHAITVFYDGDDRSRWNDAGYRYRPGERLEDARYLMRHDPSHPVVDRMLRNSEHALDDRFWPDGMVRVSGREHNGLSRSGCHTAGELRCTSCHQLHQSSDDLRSIDEWANDQLAPGAIGNGECLRCHPEQRAGVDAHTRHAADSSGSLCYNCHMPHTAYGLLKAIRSHEISSPSVRESVDAGRPNACNLCHLDRSLAWTAAQLPRFGVQDDVPAPAGADAQAASITWLLSGDAGQRALIAWHFGWPAARAAAGAEWLGAHLAPLLADPYDPVRFIAGRSLRTLPGFAGFDYDFLAAPAQREAAAQSALERWSVVERKGDEPAERKHRLLLGPDGQLDRERQRALLQRRDDRRVVLRE